MGLSISILFPPILNYLSASKIVLISYLIGIFGIGYYKELGVILQMRGGDYTNYWG